MRLFFLSLYLMHRFICLQNKCNVGYAFINMLSPSNIIPFYEVCFILLAARFYYFFKFICQSLNFPQYDFAQAFNGKKWEKFNSEKVATLAYARIQGKAALIAHFQHTSLMNEDKCCRPILFDSEFPASNDKVKPTSGL